MSTPSQQLGFDRESSHDTVSSLGEAEMSEISKEICEEAAAFMKEMWRTKVLQRKERKRLGKTQDSEDGATDTISSKKRRLVDVPNPTPDRTSSPPSSDISPNPTTLRCVASEFVFQNQTHYWSTIRRELVPFDGPHCRRSSHTKTVDDQRRRKFAPRKTSPTNSFCNH
jgi:hypothetical protein